MSENNEKYVPQKGDIVAVPMLVVEAREDGVVFAHGNGVVAIRDQKTDHGTITLISRPKPPAYFDGAKVGQDVWCPSCGGGHIREITEDSFPIRCVFISRNRPVRYSMSGKHEHGPYDVQTLFYTDDPRVAKLKAILEAPCTP